MRPPNPKNAGGLVLSSRLFPGAEPLRRIASAGSTHWIEAALIWGLLAAGTWVLARGFAGGLWLTVVGGLALIIVSAFAYGGFRQRAQFRAGALGPGIVRIIEGRIGYLGPFSGGIADAGGLYRVEIATRTRNWRLHRDGERPLEIPVDAAGATGVFDAVAALPGAMMGEAARALEIEPGPVVLVWERARKEQRSRLAPA